MADTVVLFNKDSGLAEEMPKDQADQSLAQGTHEIPLLNPEGQMGAASLADAQNLIGQGYYQPGHEQLGSLLKTAKYRAPLERAKSVAEGALSSATFGAGTGLEAGLLGNQEEIRNRREINRPENLVGQGLGLLLPGGLAGKALKGAGELATGLGETAGLLGTTGAQRIGQAALKSAVESAMVSGGDEVSKAFTNDPAQSWETAATNIGLYGVLGGAGVGAAFGAVPEAWKALQGTPAMKLLGVLKDKAQGIEGETLPYENLDANAAKAGIEITPLQRAALGGNPEAKRMAQELIASGSGSGEEARLTIEGKIRQDAHDALLGAVGKTPEQVDAASEFSSHDLGVQMRDAVNEDLKGKLAGPAAQFEQVAQKLKGSEVTAADQAMLADEVGKISNEMNPDLLEGTAAGGLLGRVLKSIPNIKDLEQLRKFQTQLRDAAGPETWGIVKKIGKVLRSTETELVTRNLGEEAPELLAAHQEARSQYRALMDHIDSLNDRLHVGRYDGPSSFMNALKDMKPEDVLDRLTPKNDAGLLQMLGEHSPQVGALVKESYLAQLLKTAAKRGVQEGQAINPKPFFSGLDAWSPELRQFVLPAGAEGKIQAVREILGAVPTRINPSGTARGLDAITRGIPGSIAAILAFMTHHNPALGYVLGSLGRLVGREGLDAIKLATLKFLGSDAPLSGSAFKVLAELATHTYQGESLIGKAAKNLFQAGAPVLPQAMEPSSKDVEKLKKRVEATQTDTASLFNTGGQMGHYAPEHATQAAAMAVRATQYLNGLKPKTQALGPLDPNRTPPQAETAAYLRQLKIAQQPLVALQHAKEGTLTRQDVTTVQTIYPALYEKLSHQITGAMIDHISKDKSVPYKTRIGLSRFLGQPLDSTLTPSAIISAQPKPTTKAQTEGDQTRGMSQAKGNALGKIGQMTQTTQQAREAKRAAIPVA